MDGRNLNAIINSEILLLLQGCRKQGGLGALLSPPSFWHYS